MIEVLLFVGLLLVIILAVWILGGSVDNTFALEFKDSIDERFRRYPRTEPLVWCKVSKLVAEVRFCCDQIALSTRLWDAKRGAMYAQAMKPLLDELKELGFFEKTRDDSLGVSGYRCNICGNDMWRSRDCLHWPGITYIIEEDDKRREVKCVPIIESTEEKGRDQ